eukprot:GHUV01026559.1.p2 GENE.GHUV01026559.1~~GHUV01026559.1.p2  ORF type:complete len:202 (+),score=45.60 GHUV01026559.1:1953-2558(+)
MGWKSSAVCRQGRIQRLGTVVYMCMSRSWVSIYSTVVQQLSSVLHADVLLPFSDLASGAAQLLQPSGRLCLILPAVEAQHFAAVAAQHGLQLTRLMQVFTRCQDMEPKRHIMQFEFESEHKGLPIPSHSTDFSNHRSPVGPQTANEDGVAVATGFRGAEQRLVVMERGIDPATGKAVHVYSQQYQQLTRDYHHPSMFQRGS